MTILPQSPIQTGPKCTHSVPPNKLPVYTTLAPKQTGPLPPHLCSKQELYEDTDAVTGRWLSHAASLLSACASQLPLLLRQPSPRQQQQRHAGEGSGSGKGSGTPAATEPSEGAAKAALDCAATCPASGCVAQQQLPGTSAIGAPVGAHCCGSSAGLPGSAAPGHSSGTGAAAAGVTAAGDAIRPGSCSPGQGLSAAAAPAAAAAGPGQVIPLAPSPLPPPPAAAAAAAAGHSLSPPPTAAAPASAPPPSVGFRSSSPGGGAAPEAGPGLEVVHVAVTSGQLIPSLAKLMLFRLAAHFAPDRVSQPESWELGAAAEPRASCCCLSNAAFPLLGLSRA